MTDLPDWGDLLLTVAAVLVALGTIYRYIFPALRAGWRLAQGTAKLIEDFRDTGGFGGLAEHSKAISRDVAAVKKELYPNGGSSLRDSVTRTEHGLQAIASRTDDLAAQIEAVSERAQALGERQEVLRAADQQLALDLQHYIETKHADLLMANEALRSALNETLAIDNDEL